MRLNWRRTIRICGIAVGVVLCLTAGLLVFLHSGYAREAVLKRIQAEARAQNLLFEAEGLDYNLWRGELSLTRGEVKSALQPEMPPVFRVERLAVQVALGPLLRGDLDVKQAEVLRPVVHVLVGRDGSTNLPHIPPGGEPGEPVEWIVRQLQLAGGTVRFEDLRNQVEMLLPELEAELKAANGDGHEAKLRLVRDGYALYRGESIGIGQLAWEGRWRGDELTLAPLELTTDVMTARVTGKVLRLSDPLLELDAELALELERLEQVAGLSQQITGRIVGKARVQGSVEKLAVNSEWLGERLNLGPVRGVRWLGQLQYDPNLSRVFARQWQAQSELGTLRANGSMTLAGGNSNLTLELDRVAVDRAAALAGETPIAVASTLSGRLEARMPGTNVEAAEVLGRVRLEPTQAAITAKRVPVTAEVKVQGGRQRLEVDVERLVAGGLDAVAKIAVRDLNTLEGGFQVEAESLAKVVEAADALAVERGTRPDLDGQARLWGSVSGTVNAPEAAVEASLREVRSGIVSGVEMEARSRATTSGAVLEGFTAKWLGQRVDASGELEWTGPSPRFHLEASTAGLAIERVLQGIGQASVPVEGRAEVNLELNGTMAQPKGVLAVSGSGWKAYGEPLGAVRGVATLDGEEIRLEEWKLGRGLTLTGQANWNAETYTFAAEAPQWTLDGLTLGGEKAVTGELQLKASGQGRFSAPSGQMEVGGKALELGGVALGNWQAAAKLGAGWVDWQAEGERFGLKSEGRVEVGGGHRLEAQVKTEGTRVASLPVPADLPLAGVFDTALKLSANWQQPLEALAELRLTPRDWAWNGQQVEFAQPLEAKLKEGFVSLAPAAVKAAGASVVVEGRLPVEPQRGMGEVKLSGGAALAEATRLVPDWDAAVKLGGEMEWDVRATGNLEALDPRGEIRLREGTVTLGGQTWLTALQGQVGLEEGAARFSEFRGESLGGRLELSGALPYGLLPENLGVEIPRQAGPAKVQAKAEGLDPARAPGAPENLSGRVSARVEGTADGLDVEQVRGRAVFEEMRFRLGDIVLEQQSPSVLEARQGSVRVENLTLAGPGTELALRGRLGLKDDLPLQARLAGRLETGVLSTLAEPLKLSGPARVEVSAYGPAATPQLAGFVEWTGGTLRLPEPRLAAEKIDARVHFTGEEARIVRFGGELNGGTLEAAGGLRFVDGKVEKPDLRVTAKNVYLDYPTGLRTISGADLRLEERGTQGFVLGGNLTVEEGVFREPVTLEGGLLAALNQPAADVPAERDPFLEQLAYNVTLKTATPVVVQNNLAKAGLALDLRLTGDYYQPSLLGRATIEEGGQLFFAERAYTVERGMVTFTNEQKIEPTLDILARTRVAGHDISLNLSGGGAERLETRLAADPPASEPDILSMLITGRPVEDVRGSDPANLAGRQAMSYFAGSFGSRFTRQIERSTGLSMVRVEPDLIANEANPTARLTVGQDITNAARLIYSMNLTDGGDQIYVAEYDLTRRFTTRAVKQVDNTYRFEFRHDVRLGLDKPAVSGLEEVVRRRVGEVKLPAAGPVPEELLRQRLKLKPGKVFDFFAARKGVDRITGLLERQDYLEARVKLERETTPEGLVDVTVVVDAGPKVEFVYEGWEAPGGVRRRVREAWRDGVFDLQRSEEAEAVIRRELIAGGYPRAAVRTAVEEEGDTKRVRFAVAPGEKQGAVGVEFPGAEKVLAKDLEGVLRRAKLETALLLEPGKVRDRVEAHYRQMGYLDVKVGLPRMVEEVTERVVVRVPVTEGAQAVLKAVEVVGAEQAQGLSEATRLVAGQVYVPALRNEAVSRVREKLVGDGYAEAVVESELAREGAEVTLRLQVKEGPRAVLAGIEVEGTRATSEGLVRGQVALQEGETLTPQRLAESRRNLYSTGAYSLVDLARVPAEVAAGGVQPMVLKAKVREVAPVDLRYGAYFDTDRGPGGVVDITNRNTLGAARAVGGRLRYDNNFREARAFFSQPLLRTLPLQNIVSTYVNRQLLPSFITDRTGFSVQQEYRFRRIYLLNYGYRFERTRTYDRVPDEFFPFDVTLKVAPLTFTMNRETRDDFLDATRGSFLSHGLQYAPAGIGSDIRFVRYYGQFFKYVPLSKPEEVPLSGGMMRPRWVYAGAARVGLARGLGGQELIRTERFFAGGGTTLRGFAQNTLGPTDFFGDPAGGNAVVLLNQELRFPAYGIFDGVGFVDVGNVFPTVRDFSLGNLRKTVGAGVRIRTPYFLIRLDYGFKLDRRPGERVGSFFFSIGQAF